MTMKLLFITVIAAAVSSLCSLPAEPSPAAEPPSAMSIPDFTKGDRIPEGASHDWNLGATGARGWIFCDKLVTSDARQIFLHQGPPEMQNDSYPGWDCTGVYLLAYAMPLNTIRWNGKRPSTVPQLDPAVAEALIRDGRGWSNKDRDSFFDNLDEPDLLRRLSSWSPVVRERAAIALSRRQDAPVSKLVEMLNSRQLESRYGACQALAMLKAAAAPAVPALQDALQDDDLWLRVKAADALAAVGQPAISAVPELLQMLAKDPSQNDPRGMEQRYLCFALFNSRGGLIGRSLAGVDRGLLVAAVCAGLRNQDGRARGSLGSVYQNLNYDEIKPLLPAIHRAIVEPAPSGIMFADEIRLKGLTILAKHRVQEGIDACVEYTRTQNPWASEKRTPELMKILLAYGAHAKPTIPALEQIADYFENDEQDFPRKLSLEKAKTIRETILAINASNEYPELVRIDQLRQ